MTPDGDGIDRDTRLMVDFAAGDDAAFDRIVEVFARQVFGLVSRYVGDPGRAEDCAQEVFLRLYRMRRSYRPTAKLSTLVYRITTNLCLNFLRDEKRRRMVSLDEARGGEDLPMHRYIADRSAVAPDEAVEAAERAAVVRRALDAIPPRQRMALVLHRFEGLSYSEIADAMEVNVAAVKSLLSRARLSLAAALKGDLEAGNI